MKWQSREGPGELDYTQEGVGSMELDHEMFFFSNLRKCILEKIEIAKVRSHSVLERI